MQEIENLLVNSTSKELIRELEFRCLYLEKINHRVVQQRLLRALIASEQVAVQCGLPYIWTLVCFGSFIHFFSEVVLWKWGNSIYACGPFFPTPRDKPITIVAKLDQQEKPRWEGFPISGKNVNPFVAFKRMPISFMADDTFYMVYSNSDEGRLVVDYLDMHSAEWNELNLYGAGGIGAKDYIDGGLYKGDLYVLTLPVENEKMVLHKITLRTGEFRPITCYGDLPNFPNGCSLIRGNQLYTFAKDGDALYSLNLDTFMWAKTVITPLPEFNPRRHSHLIQIYGDQMLLIRSCDAFRLNHFSLTAMRWGIIDTFGKRPNKVRTEASFLLVGNELFALGGQAGKNHFLCLNLKPGDQKAEPIESPPAPSLFSRLYQGGFEDLAFVFNDGTRLLAHRSVIAAKSEVFQKMLTNGMAESSRSETDPNESLHEIHIQDVQPEIFRVIIYFFYDMLNLEELQEKELDFGLAFQAAGKYLLTPLQDRIAEYLLATISLEMAIPILRLISAALTPVRAKYYYQVMHYVAGQMDKITNQETFTEMCKEEPDLISDILEFYGRGKNSKKRPKFANLTPYMEELIWFTKED